MFHHVLLSTNALDDLERPVFVRVRSTDTLPPPSTDRYRVLASPVPLGGDFCLVTPERERFCSFGVEHRHTEDEWTDPNVDVRVARLKEAHG